MKTTDKIYTYGLGLDASKDKVDCCLRRKDDSGRQTVVATRKFPMTPKGFSDLLSWVLSKVKAVDLLHQVVLEATGVYHEKLLYFLHEQGLPVCLVKGKYASDYKKSIGYISKNDKIDGRCLAQLSLERELRKWKPASAEILQIRSLLRHRKALVEGKVVLENRLHALNHAHDPNTDVIDSLKELIAQYKAHARQAEKAAKTLAQKDPKFWENFERIESSLPGIGFVSLMTVLAEANGFEDFDNMKQIVSYAGYDVVENQSGKFAGKTRISKQGNAHIRSVLYMPALTAVRLGVEPLENLYLRVVQRNPKAKKIAQVAVQRKLLTYIYTLWKNEEAFEPEYYKIHHKQLHTALPLNNDSPGNSPELHKIEQPMACPS